MKKKIKVLQLGSPSGLYGAERWILALIKNLDKQKIESLVAAVKDEPEMDILLCAEAEKFGFRSYVFNCQGKINFSSVRVLRNFIKENGIDILHTHGYKTDLVGLLAVRGTSCKIVTTPHGWTKQPDLKLRIYEILDRIIFPLMDAVVPLSYDLYKPLSVLPGIKNKIHLITNGVDVDEINNIRYVADEISILKKKGCFVIGYIGRLTRGKGLDILLSAVAKYGEMNWHAAIVGDGEHQEEFNTIVAEHGIKNRVSFFGYRQDRLAFLNGFDLFVLPSRSEGTPRCLMEAMIAGVPVVASNIPGCRTLVDGEKTGILFQPDNPKDLAESIKKLKSDPYLRKSMISAGQEFIQQKFSAKRMAGEYEKLFFRLCNIDQNKIM